MNNMMTNDIYDSDIEVYPQLFRFERYLYEPSAAGQPFGRHPKCQLLMLSGLALRPINRFFYIRNRGWLTSPQARLLSSHDAVSFMLAGLRQYQDSPRLKYFLELAMKMPRTDVQLLHLPEIKEAIDIVLSAKSAQHGYRHVN